MPQEAANFTSLRFSTRELPERMRIPIWREEFGRRIVHVDIEPSSDLPFQAEATLQALRGLRTLAWQGSAMRFKRSRADIVDGDDSIGIVVSSPSRSQLSQRGREIEFRAGDARAADFRHRARGRLFGYFAFQPTIPRPLRRLPAWRTECPRINRG
jgi:hypothetical protein